MSDEKQVYACGHCGKPIKTGCYCSTRCANADDQEPDPEDPCEAWARELADE